MGQQMGCCQTNEQDTTEGFDPLKALQSAQLPPDEPSAKPFGEKLTPEPRPAAPEDSGEYGIGAQLAEVLRHQAEQEQQVSTALDKARHGMSNEERDALPDDEVDRVCGSVAQSLFIPVKILMELPQKTKREYVKAALENRMKGEFHKMVREVRKDRLDRLEQYSSELIDLLAAEHCKIHHETNLAAQPAREMLQNATRDWADEQKEQID